MDPVLVLAGGERLNSGQFCVCHRTARVLRQARPENDGASRFGLAWDPLQSVLEFMPTQATKNVKMGEGIICWSAILRHLPSDELLQVECDLAQRSGLVSISIACGTVVPIW